MKSKMVTENLVNFLIPQKVGIYWELYNYLLKSILYPHLIILEK